MIDELFLKNLFDLYLHNEEVSRANKVGARPLSCFAKYRKSLPNDYTFQYPNAVILKVTEACNLRCKHCFYAGQPDFYNKRFEFSTEELIALINFLADELNIIFLTFTGGEVFVRKDFLDVLAHAKRKNLLITVQTNGVLVDEEKAQMLGKILNPKTDFLQISLEGADKNSHDEIRGIGTFDKTTQAIKLLRQNNVNVQINTTLTTISAPNMEQMFELCKKLNVKQLSIGKYEVCDEKQQYLKLTTEKLMECNSTLLTKAKSVEALKVKNKSLSIFDFLNMPQGRALVERYIINNNMQIPQKKCLTCHNHNKITISSEGNVFFCSMDESKEAILGNLREKDFYEIWENRFNTPYFQKRDLTTSKCKNCKFIPLCNTGCMASARKKYGDINCAAADCSYFEEYIKEQNG